MQKHLPVVVAAGALIGTLALLPDPQPSVASAPREDRNPSKSSANHGSVVDSQSVAQSGVPDDFAPIPHVSEAARQFSPFVQRIEQIAERQEMAQTPGSGAAGPGHHRIPPEIRAKSDSELRDMLTDEMQGRLARYERQLSDFDPEHRRYFCWGPDTAPEVVEAFRRVEAAAGLVPGQVRTLAFQFVGGGHWGRTATDGSGVGTQGQPVTVTWSIAPDGTTVPSGDEDPAGPSDLIAWLDSLYPGTVTSDLTQRVWFPLMQEAMDDLAAQAGLNLVYEPNDDGATFTNFSSGQGQLGVRGDIRISGRDIDGNNGVLGFAYSPDYGDIVLETYDSFYNSTSNNSIGFVNVLTHEVGHALGLGHVCPVNQTKLMEPFINTGFRGAQFDETYSLQRQYADELEVHSGISNNDSASNATPVTLSVGSTTSWKYLSIDDSSDVDYLAFSANAGEAVTVRVIPGDPAVGSYLEGQQNSDGSCTAGTSFDPTAQQDLTIEVLSTNGSTVLATANSQPSGSTEELIEVPLPSTGTYYLRINGGSADRSQLYELQAELVVPDPAPLLVVDSTRLIDESNSGANGAADPGETVLLGVTVTNVGALAASNLSATLTGPSGFVAFDTTDDLASLAASASAELVFLFAPDGACGDSLILSLAVSDDSGYSDALQVPLDLGVPTSVPLIDEDFDGSASLPPGWTQSTSGGASPWVVSSTNADTPPNAAFSPGVTSVGDAFLNVFAGIIDSDGPTLSFRHSFDLENQRDGAVLEARLDGGSWFDLLGSAATVSAGGYSSTIGGGGRPTLRSSLDGRNAWTGSSGGFITTSIDLPSAWGGQNLELRWLLAHDSGTAGAGWYVDSVELGGAQVFVCDTFRPTVTLGAAGNTLIEGDNASSVDLTLSTPLPLAAELSVSPLISGEADASDLVAAPSFVLPVGGSSTVASVSAAADASNEGTEEITFSLPGSDPGFAAGTPSSVSINIEEGELTATVFLSDLSKVFNGSPQGVTVTTSPEGLSTSVTYDGSSTIPTNAGSYDVVVTVTEPNYSGSALGTLVISPATATVTLSDTSKTYDGTAQGVMVTTVPVSLPVDVTYNGFSTVPTDAGSYTVVATVTDPNYSGSDTDTLVIDPATATVTLSDTSKTYDGTPQGVTVTTDPVDLPVDVIYDGSGTVPTDAGTYAVVATVSDPNYAGSDSGSLVIGQATATVTLSDTSKTYDGTPQGVTVTTDPVDLPADVTYDGSSTIPTDAGTYAVVATVSDSNYTGSDSGSLVIGQATATVTLSDTSKTYDGTPQEVTVTTDPVDLPVDVTYDGSGTVPTDAGTYAVVAAVNDPNYTGSDSGSLVIAKATAGVVVDSLNVLYDGQPKPVGVSTNPSGLTTQVTYDGLEEAPSAVGSYSVVVEIDDANYEGTANELLTIEASLDSWRESFGLVSADPFADEDGDGWFAVAEYLYDTDPTNGTSSPSMVPMLDATTFSLVTPPPVDRPDASVVGEVSSGLSQWTSDGVTDTGTGFSVPRSEPSRFLRLRFSYDSGE